MSKITQKKDNRHECKYENDKIGIRISYTWEADNWNSRYNRNKPKVGSMCIKQGQSTII